MFDVFDDELKQMFDEQKNEEKQKLNIAISLNDPIKSLLKNKYICLQEDTTLDKIIDEIKKYSTGCVLLQNTNQISGILTERDVINKILGRRLNLKNEIVSKYMTKNPECLHLDDPISFALNKMVSGGFRHIPLINENNNPLGVISMQDVINQLGDFFFDEIINLPPKPLREQTNREGG